MRPLPIMPCVHQSLNGTCVASCSSLSFCVDFVSGSCSHTPVGRCQFFFTVNSISFFIGHFVFSLFNSIQFCSFNFFNFSVVCFITSTQCCRPYKLVESGLTTHCPCQPKAGPVSSRQIHMSIVHTPLFTSRLIIVPSRVFRMCGFFSSNTTMFPTRTTFCIEMKRFDNTRTSECYASLNAFVCLEWNSLFTQVSDLFTIRCHKSQWWCFAV